MLKSASPKAAPLPFFLCRQIEIVVLAIWFVIDVEDNDTAALSPSDNTTGPNDDGCSAATGAFPYNP